MFGFVIVLLLNVLMILGPMKGPDTGEETNGGRGDTRRPQGFFRQ